MESSLEVIHWGLIDYKTALQQQLELVQQVDEAQSDGVIVICSHPAVVTLGRATQPGDVFGWNGPIEEIARGGRATYHGPSQCVIYPILNLKKERKGRKPQEIHGYLRDLEQAIVDTLIEYELPAIGKTVQKNDLQNTSEEATGVWIDQQKVASLGIGIKKWITYHGAAINVDHDAEAFVGMNPCGFSSNVMTSVEKKMGHEINRAHFEKKLIAHLLERL